MGTYTKNLFKKRKQPPADTPFIDSNSDDGITIESAMLEPVEGANYIKLWIDDTRKPDDDWVWVKSYRDAIELFDQNENYIVTMLGVDYYMDHDNRGAPAGPVIVDELANRMHYLDRPQVFGHVARINCHSSDRDMRVKTAKVINELQKAGLINPNARISINNSLW